MTFIEIRLSIVKRYEIKSINKVKDQINITVYTVMPRYHKEDRAMPMYISIPIELYNGIARFLCHSTHFFLVFVCRLQCIICQKVTSARKNQSDRTADTDK